MKFFKMYSFIKPKLGKNYLKLRFFLSLKTQTFFFLFRVMVLANTKGFKPSIFYKIKYANVSSVTKLLIASENGNVKDYEDLKSSVTDMKINEAFEKGDHNKDSCENSDG